MGDVEKLTQLCLLGTLPVPGGLEDVKEDGADSPDSPMTAVYNVMIAAGPGMPFSQLELESQLAALQDTVECWLSQRCARLAVPVRVRTVEDMTQFVYRSMRVGTASRLRTLFAWPEQSAAVHPSDILLGNVGRLFFHADVQEDDDPTWSQMYQLVPRCSRLLASPSIPEATKDLVVLFSSKHHKALVEKWTELAADAASQVASKISDVATRTVQHALRRVPFPVMHLVHASVLRAIISQMLTKNQRHSELSLDATLIHRAFHENAYWTSPSRTARLEVQGTTSADTARLFVDFIIQQVNMHRDMPVDALAASAATQLTRQLIAFVSGQANTQKTFRDAATDIAAAAEVLDLTEPETVRRLACFHHWFCVAAGSSVESGVTARVALVRHFCAVDRARTEEDVAGESPVPGLQQRKLANGRQAKLATVQTLNALDRICGMVFSDTEGSTKSYVSVQTMRQVVNIRTAHPDVHNQDMEDVDGDVSWLQFSSLESDIELHKVALAAYAAASTLCAHAFVHPKCRLTLYALKGSLRWFRTYVLARLSSSSLTVSLLPLCRRLLLIANAAAAYGSDDDDTVLPAQWMFPEGLGLGSRPPPTGTRWRHFLFRSRSCKQRTLTGVLSKMTSPWGLTECILNEPDMEFFFRRVKMLARVTPPGSENQSTAFLTLAKVWYGDDLQLSSPALVTWGSCDGLSSYGGDAGDDDPAPGMVFMNLVRTCSFFRELVLHTAGTGVASGTRLGECLLLMALQQGLTALAIEASNAASVSTPSPSPSPSTWTCAVCLSSFSCDITGPVPQRPSYTCAHTVCMPCVVFGVCAAVAGHAYRAAETLIGTPHNAFRCVACPGCQGTYLADAVKPRLPEFMLAIAGRNRRKFKAARAVIRGNAVDSGSWFACVVCGEAVRRTDTVSTCPTCGDVTCTQCGAVAHPGSVCIKTLMRSASGSGSATNTTSGLSPHDLLSEAKLVPCPVCRTPYWKNEGCNHMTCTAWPTGHDCRCGTHFCFVCGLKLSPEHYDSHFAPQGVCNKNAYSEETERERITAVLQRAAETRLSPLTKTEVDPQLVGLARALLNTSEFAQMRTDL